MTTFGAEGAAETETVVLQKRYVTYEAVESMMYYNRYIMCRPGIMRHSSKWIRRMLAIHFYHVYFARSFQSPFASRVLSLPSGHSVRVRNIPLQVGYRLPYTPLKVL
jgi:hypothetical protein